MSDVVSEWFAKAAWLRFFRYLRMMMIPSMSIVSPAVGTTIETMMICVERTWRTGTEFTVGATEGNAVAEAVAVCPRYVGMDCDDGNVAVHPSSPSKA